MKTNFRRIALFTGVSAAALGISGIAATPALAQVAPPPPAPDGTYPGDFTFVQTIEICDLATPPGSPCVFGVVDTGSPVATANVNTFVEGQVAQLPGTGTATLSNNGTATFAAYAGATNGAGGAVADATAVGLVAQKSGSVSSADYTIDNNGNLVIEAVAKASATGATGDANANAILNNAIRQSASATSDVALTITNDDLLTVNAIASAVAPGAANANAVLGSGGITIYDTGPDGAIHQTGTGDNVDLSIVNNGTMDLGAVAFASGGAGASTQANADAFVQNAIVQSANASTDASVDLTNGAGALITIHATASAFGGNANAGSGSTGGAIVDGGIIQSVSADGGLATANINNDGAIAIAANAYASGTTSVDAIARVTNAMYQSAAAGSLFKSGGDATVGLDNNGSITIDIQAIANGVAGGTPADAVAVGNSLIVQHAVAFDDSAAGAELAQVNISNGAGGSIVVNASAIASGAEGDAEAFASVDGFIVQSATGFFGANASANLDNAGLISINVLADANAGSDAYGTGTASATAILTDGISQNVNGASAEANLSNAAGATIALNASAYATGGYVTASAQVNSGIRQDVLAKSGDALALIENDGLIDIGAYAAATGDARAQAYINGGINQNAVASGIAASTPTIGDISLLAPVLSTGPDAAATMVNNGTIQIHATAIAHDTVTGPATATAQVNDAIVQNAYATNGNATVGISGTGSIDISAIASATADFGRAFASAAVDTGINMVAAAQGGDASAFLTQDGGIDVMALANANGQTSASATASIGNGIAQVANAVNTGDDSAVANVAMVNDGTVNIFASANAVAPGITIFGTGSTAGVAFPAAFASADVGTGIDQNAVALAGGFEVTTSPDGATIDAYGTATASVTYTNNGSLLVGARAVASAASASALANVGIGIDQAAVAVGGQDAYATVALVNGTDAATTDAVINVIASASALGTTNADASAGVGVGINQTAFAVSKEGSAVANASLDNSGSINVSANANAIASGQYLFGTAVLGDADATASIGTGIDQLANAQGIGITAIDYVTGVSFAGDASAVAAIDNSGSIIVSANANAQGDEVSAEATIGIGIDQEARAVGVETATASASIDNSGTIAVVAGAVAIGSTFAGAYATIGTGIDQLAFAAAKSGSANANADLTNSNSITIAAIANASATSVNTGVATASIGVGINQSAIGIGSFGQTYVTGGAAAATLNNSGNITVLAIASATGNSASALASIGTGINQFALGYDSAVASVYNSGAITIAASAQAGGEGVGFATADAFIGLGIGQTAIAVGPGGNATATLDNSGSIRISANAAGGGAIASDGSAFASATIGTAINQYAQASSEAHVGLQNSGSLTVLASASALADDDAEAVAGIGLGIFQSAFATGDSGNASASVTNSGSLLFAANAYATGGDTVLADAYVNGAVVQNAFGGTSGTATVSFSNDGPLQVLANAQAVGGGDGTALAAALGGSQLAVAGSGASVSITNTDYVTVLANADVLVGNAAGKGASAFASAVAIGFNQTAVAVTGTSSTAIAFTDAFTAGAATSDTLADVAFTATTTATFTPSGPASASFVNEGTLTVGASASAVGDDDANAIAFAGAVAQLVRGDPATATAVNTADASINVDAIAYASGDNGAAAVAGAYGILQVASAGASAYQTVFAGSGVIHLSSNYATTLQSINAGADATASVTFTPVGLAQASAYNSGAISVAASATAVVNLGSGQGVTNPAFASATAIGIGQAVRGAPAYATVVNTGSIAVSARAAANGATSAAAFAAATGVLQGASAVEANFAGNFQYQTVTGIQGAGGDTPGHTFSYLTFVLTDSATSLTNVGEASVSLTNSGTIDVAASAEVTGGAGATASAFAAGVVQLAAGTVASAYATNSGDISVFANAYASGSSAGAVAGALGVGQFLSGTDMFSTMINTGDIGVVAMAHGYGSGGSASATAVGLVASGTGGDLTVNVLNDAGASLFVAASAVASDTAVATAQGIILVNAPSAYGTGLVGNPISGYVTNAGTLSVLAMASGGTFTTPTAGAGTSTVALSSAYATGIGVQSGINNLTITNSGTLNVDAITANGGNAEAYGIRVQGNGDVTPTAGDVLTINNSGDIIVRVSNDGGTTFHRGEAIDVSEAPNRTVINLLGGNIFGNINDQAGDDINVTTDETVFNGVINPECLPAGGPTALTLDDPAQNLCGQGSLTISDGGNLHLVIDPVDGPSYGFVNVFTVTADGTIEYDLPAPNGGGTIPIGTYPQIFTDVANLDGTLIANIPAPANGLFDDTVYENVIDAITRNGTFDQCIVNGIPANSLLLDFGCVYDNQANVDLRIDRIGFDLVPGLNDNGTSVGEGLECIFDTSLTGGIADLLSDLFLFTDPVNYNIALNQLSGSAYANYLQSFPSLGVHYNDLLAKATDCEIPALAGSVLECRASAPIHVWGQLDYQHRKADGDDEAGTTKSKRFTGLLGVDANVGNSAILGVSAGAVTNHTRDNQFGDKVDAGGMQVGAYGVYDPGAFYVKAMTTYSWYDGDSNRNINFAGLAPGATFAGETDGDPDVTMWTFGLHGGYRMGLGGNSVLTPYLNYDYVNAKLKSFTENGLDGANLTVLGGRAKHSFLTGGAKWATQLGGVVPEVNLGYRYRFGEKRSDFRAAFIGDTDCDFDIVSAAQKRGTFLAGLSIGGKLGPVDLRIGYEGEFNSDITSHSGNFKFVLPLGGRAAPPPPPAPVMAPPPPPPPPVEVAPPPPPPPPPPAPVERGERGQ